MTAYIFDSPLVNAANLLRDELAARQRPITDGLIVRTKMPTERNSAELTPLIVVTQDGPGQVRQRVHQDAALRVLAWHRTADDTDELIRYAHAVFGAAGGVGTGIRSVLPGTAPWVDTDPDTGNPMGVFTCAVQTIADALTE